MSDPILSARVEALTQSLIRARRAVQLIDGILDGDEDNGQTAGRRGDLVHPELWQNLDYQVDQLNRRCLGDLVKIRGLLNSGEVASAWHEYALAQERSQELFQGCFEFIGGAAFRREIDRADAAHEHREIGAVADELMIEAAVAALNRASHYFTVPALEEALTDSRVRTIRLRFPDWTVWNLPLMAHDFGHVAIAEYQGIDRDMPLTALLKARTGEVMKGDESLQERLKGIEKLAARAGLERRSRRACRHRIRVLIADAYATHWMGPGYACAAIHLRFDPSTAHAGNPSFSERAAIVIKTLETMGKTEDHLNVAKSLRAQWDAAVGEADLSGQAAAASEAFVNELHRAIADTLEELPSAALFGRTLWYRASAKQVDWVSQFDSQDLLSTKPDAKDGLRDVLNAAWLCRLERADPELLKQVANAALAQCIAIRARAREERANGERRGQVSRSELKDVS